MYADDTQLYISFSLTDEETLMQQLETCICDIDIWMVNRLKQNGEKTGSLHIQGWRMWRVLEWHWTAVWPLTNMSVPFAVHTASLHIRNIGKIRLLTRSMTEKLVHAFITARMVYYNNSCKASPRGLFSVFRTTQHAWCRDDHITPVLKSLHLQGTAAHVQNYPLQRTTYLSVLVFSYTPSRSLRSS